MNLELNGENNRSKRDAYSKVTRETRATAGEYNWVAYLERFGENATAVSAEAHLKGLWKTVFTNKKTEVFNAMKPELKESLQLFSPDDLTSNKIDAILNVIIKAE